MRRSVLWLLLGLAVAVLGGIGLYFITESVRSSSGVWRFAAVVVSALAAVITSELAFRSNRMAAGTYELVYWVYAKGSDTPTSGVVARTTTSGHASNKPAQLLVDQVVGLEVDAQSVLDRVLGGRNRTIFDLRADLAHTGIWTFSDVEDFDRAVRVRNAAVHGDSVSEKDVATASKTVRRLRSRLDEAPV